MKDDNITKFLIIFIAKSYMLRIFITFSANHCQQFGYNNGNIVYAGVKPLEGGYFQRALYTDSNCLSKDTSGATYDDYYQNAAYDNANQGGSRAIKIFLLITILI